ncbi:reverse transcriptase domain-containing protein [Tanacetum coccineum]
MTPKALVHHGDETSGDARSWYMISGDAKSWVVIVLHIFTVILHNCPLYLTRRLVEEFNTLLYIERDAALSEIIPSRMTTRSAGRPAAASRGRGTGGQDGRGGGRTRDRSGLRMMSCLSLKNDMPLRDNTSRGNGGIEGQGRQVAGQGTKVAKVAIRGMVGIKTVRLTQKVMYTAGSFVGKALTWWKSQIHIRGREAATGMSWEDFKNLTREEFCLSNEIQKLETELWNHTMVGVGHAAYTNRFHELARLVPHLVTLERKRIERYIYGLALQIRGMVAVTEPPAFQKAMQIAGILTDEALRNGSMKKNHEKRGNRGDPNKDRNEMEDNKRTRTGNAFATTTDPVRRENTCTAPKFKGQGKSSEPSRGCVKTGQVVGTMVNRRHVKGIYVGAVEAR